eukprot:ANDGO_00497.mRNA.1 Eukaryotic translation initiation factor 2-alpha kinase
MITAHSMDTSELTRVKTLLDRYIPSEESSPYGSSSDLGAHEDSSDSSSTTSEKLKLVNSQRRFSSTSNRGMQLLFQNIGESDDDEDDEDDDDDDDDDDDEDEEKEENDESRARERSDEEEDEEEEIHRKTRLPTRNVKKIGKHVLPPLSRLSAELERTHLASRSRHAFPLSDEESNEESATDQDDNDIDFSRLDMKDKKEMLILAMLDLLCSKELHAQDVFPALVVKLKKHGFIQNTRFLQYLDEWRVQNRRFFARIFQPNAQVSMRRSISEDSVLSAKIPSAPCSRQASPGPSPTSSPACSPNDSPLKQAAAAAKTMVHSRSLVPAFADRQDVVADQSVALQQHPDVMSSLLFGSVEQQQCQLERHSISFAIPPGHGFSDGKGLLANQYQTVSVSASHSPFNPSATAPHVTPSFITLGSTSTIVYTVSRLLSEFHSPIAIGKGGFGKVFRVRHNTDGHEYAVKRVRISFRSVRDLEKRYSRVIREVQMLARLDHPNIVRYYQAWLEPVLAEVDCGKSLKRLSRRPSKKGSRAGSRRSLVKGNYTEGVGGADGDVANGDDMIFDFSEDDEQDRNKKRMSADDFDEKSFSGVSESEDELSEDDDCDDGEENESDAEEAIDVAANVDSADSEEEIALFSGPSSSSSSSSAGRIEVGPIAIESPSPSSRVSFVQKAGRLNVQTRPPLSTSLHHAPVRTGWLTSGSPSRDSAYFSQSYTSANEDFNDNALLSKSYHSRGENCLMQRAHRPRGNSFTSRGLGAAGMGGPLNEMSVLWNCQKKRYEVFLYIQMQYCSPVTVLEYLSQSNRTVNIRQCLSIFSQMLCGVQHMHLKGIVHRDLKPSNIFLMCHDDSLSCVSDSTAWLVAATESCAPFHVKIGDLGLAKRLDDSEFGSSLSRRPSAVLSAGPEQKKSSEGAPVFSSSSETVGTHTYASPEQISNMLYNEKTDVFSMGVILLELFFPFQTLSERAHFMTTLRQAIDSRLPVELKHLPKNIVEDYPRIADWVLKCLSLKPADRPSVAQLLADPIFQPSAASAFSDEDLANLGLGKTSHFESVGTATTPGLGNPEDVPFAPASSTSRIHLLEAKVAEQASLIAVLQEQLRAALKDK